MPTDDDQPSGLPRELFHTTHWSVVLAAQQADAPGAGHALETLCRTYWYPVYLFTRRRGLLVEDAQDVTQEFFARLLERDFLRNVAREKGRFRSFLLAALKNFLAVEWRRAQAGKRGGGQTIISWEELRAEDRYAQEPVVEAAPDSLFEQRWAWTVMEQAMTRLREEFQSAGKSEQFERLKPYLSAEGTGADYERVARLLGMKPGAFKVAVHRLRRRLGELLRGVIAHTVATPDEVESELQFLVRALHQTTGGEA